MRLVFTVTDSGIGISAAEIKQLFRPFAQASERVARRYGGAGLGLVFVKRIAKAMGGDLEVTSKHGRGQHVPAHRAGRARRTPAPRRTRRRTQARRARAVASCAPRTIPTAAS